MNKFNLEIKKIINLKENTMFNSQIIYTPTDLKIDTQIISDMLWERKYSKYFIYPALSERKFSGVLPKNRTGLVDYGFDDYR